MGRFFDPDNLFFRTLSECVDIVGLSLAWAILCIPVVTAGPATAALYHTVYMVFRQGETGTYKRFFRSVWLNLKKGILSTLVFALAAALIYLLGHWYGLGAETQGAIGRVAFSYFYVVALIPVGIAAWLFALLGRFEFTLGGLFSTAFRLALAHLPSTLLVLAATAAAYVGVMTVPILLFVLPALWALVVSYPMEKVFARYLPQENRPETPEETRADLPR